MTIEPRARHVQDALRAMNVDAKVIQLDASARTAQEAAEAVGCSVGQIVKSLVFRAGKRPVLVLTSGSNRVDVRKLRALIGAKVRRASAEFVREHTGYAIGGVAPVGHPESLHTLVDEDLLRHDTVWAAAGTPFAVFACSPDILAGLGQVACVSARIRSRQLHNQLPYGSR